DGHVVIGNSGEAMIWDAPNGMRSLRQVLENDFGLDLSGWSLGLALRISDDGRVIIGRGTNPQGSLEIWRAVLNPAPLQVTEPLGSVTYIAGTEMTVRWNASGIDSVDILFSINAGDTAQVYDDLELGYPAAAGQYTFTLPDTFSRQCAILLQASEDPSLFALSDTFRMKPYILTRVDAGGNYEPFKLNEDAWNFSNLPENLWPQSWWQQFDYANGTDPHTGVSYPSSWPGWPMYARAQDFPDWPLFVDAFGTSQCYSNVSSASYSLEALLLWRKKKSDWRGSCFGMAITSLLAFDDRSTFVNLFPGIPNFQELYFLQNGAEVRKAINQLFLYQWGAPYRAHYREVWQTPPSQTLFEVQQMLISEERDDRILVLISQDPQDPGAHAVVPYRVAAHETLANHYWIYVYDNNDPEDEYRRFLINLNDDTWSYLHFPTWGGAKGLSLANPVSEYLQQPQFGKNSAAAGLPLAHAAGLVEVSFSGTHSIVLNNEAGQQSGYIDGTLVNDIAEAVPLIPITGFPHPPTGFEMPAGNYRIKMNGYSDSLAYLSATLDSLQYLYGRNDALAGQRDFLSIAEGVGFSNPDPQGRSVNLLTVMQEAQRELGVELSGIDLASGDSMHTAMPASNEYQLRNFGGDSRYDLRLEVASESAHPVFRHNEIALPGNSAHLIRPDWSDLLNQPVKILIDLGNDGTVDDSIFVAHQTTGTGEPTAAVIPERYELLQNYPNPFNPSTLIRYQLPAAGEVELAVYNLIGQRIKTLVQQHQGAGGYAVQWDGTDDAGRPVASGIYFYRLSAGKHFVQTRKMLLTR
ncbi:MAG: T9SS type A sorting domain-containing protein, partial [Calditrichaeota bacterium]|nr:T9SS type A sorting domain-containing protein [Calditrichota bacterium]